MDSSLSVSDSTIFYTNLSNKIKEEQEELNKYKKEDIDIEIIDSRKNKDFTTITFSGFKRTDVLKSLLESLIYSKIESANYWCAELVCSKHQDDIWNIFIEFYCKYIHIGNIKICIYLHEMHAQYISIKESIKDTPFEDIRNNSNIRKMYSEIVFILCESNKKPPLNYVKISKEDFKLDSLKLHFKADRKSVV